MRNNGVRAPNLASILLTGGATGWIAVAVLVFLGASPALLPLLAGVGLLSTLSLVAGAVVGVRARGAGPSRNAAEGSVDEAAGRIGPVLARWTYAGDEWAAYTEQSWAAARAGAWKPSAVLAMLTLPVSFRSSRVETVALFTAGAFVLAVAVAVGGDAVMRGRRLSLLRPTVLIGAGGVVVDARAGLGSGEPGRVLRARYVAQPGSARLEITVEHDEGFGLKRKSVVSVRVPRGREAEAVDVAGWFAERGSDARSLPERAS
ncbi:MAG TPA: hypothetical protein VGB15_02765 [Longimicrobium sp.]